MAWNVSISLLLSVFLNYPTPCSLVEYRGLVHAWSKLRFRYFIRFALLRQLMNGNQNNNNEATWIRIDVDHLFL